MTPRERVSSPDELRPGDRVEVDDDGTGPLRGVVVIDLFYRTGATWWGLVAGLSGGADHATPKGYLLAVGVEVCIYENNYPAGRVYVRRRSRESLVRARTRGYCTVADLKGIVGPGARNRE